MSDEKSQSLFLMVAERNGWWNPCGWEGRKKARFFLEVNYLWVPLLFFPKIFQKSPSTQQAKGTSRIKLLPFPLALWSVETQVRCFLNPHFSPSCLTQVLCSKKKTMVTSLFKQTRLSFLPYFSHQFLFPESSFLVFCMVSKGKECSLWYRQIETGRICPEK